jgi:hypothetical protein
MPVVLIPLHFDRDPVDRKPSAQRSIVLRPSVTNDFMTGIPVIPGSEKLPMEVIIHLHYAYNCELLIELINIFCFILGH